MFSPEAMETDRGKLGSKEEPVGSEQGSDDFSKKDDWASSKAPAPETQPPHVTSTLIPLTCQLVLFPHLRLWLDRQQQTGTAPKPGPRPLRGGTLWPKALQTKRMKLHGPASSQGVPWDSPQRPGLHASRPAPLPAPLTHHSPRKCYQVPAQTKPPRACATREEDAGDTHPCSRGHSPASGAGCAEHAPRVPTPPLAPEPEPETRAACPHSHRCTRSGLSSNMGWSLAAHPNAPQKKMEWKHFFLDTFFSTQILLAYYLL